MPISVEPARRITGCRGAPVLDAGARQLQRRADDDLVAFGPHLLDGAQARDGAPRLAATLAPGPLGLDGADLAVGEGPVFFDDVALVVEAAPEDVDEKGFRVGAMRAADPHDTLRLAGVGDGAGLALGLGPRRPVPARPSLSPAQGRELGFA